MDPWQTKWAKRACVQGDLLNLMHFRVPRSDGSISHVAVVYISDKGIGWIGMAHQNRADHYDRRRGYLKACGQAFKACATRDEGCIVVRYDPLVNRQEMRRAMMQIARGRCWNKQDEIVSRIATKEARHAAA